MADVQHIILLRNYNGFQPVLQEIHVLLPNNTNIAPSGTVTVGSLGSSTVAPACNDGALSYNSGVSSTYCQAPTSPTAYIQISFPAPFYLKSIELFSSTDFAPGEFSDPATAKLNDAVVVVLSSTGKVLRKSSAINAVTWVTEFGNHRKYTMNFELPAATGVSFSSKYGLSWYIRPTATYSEAISMCLNDRKVPAIITGSAQNDELQIAQRVATSYLGGRRDGNLYKWRGTTVSFYDGTSTQCLENQYCSLLGGGNTIAVISGTPTTADYLVYNGNDAATFPIGWGLLANPEATTVSGIFCSDCDRWLKLSSASYTWSGNHTINNVTSVLLESVRLSCPAALIFKLDDMEKLIAETCNDTIINITIRDCHFDTKFELWFRSKFSGRAGQAAGRNLFWHGEPGVNTSMIGMYITIDNCTFTNAPLIFKDVYSPASLGVKSIHIVVKNSRFIVTQNYASAGAFPLVGGPTGIEGFDAGGATAHPTIFVAGIYLNVFNGTFSVHSNNITIDTVAIGGGGCAICFTEVGIQLRTLLVERNRISVSGSSDMGYGRVVTAIAFFRPDMHFGETFSVADNNVNVSNHQATGGTSASGIWCNE